LLKEVIIRQKLPGKVIDKAEKILYFNNTCKAAATRVFAGDTAVEIVNKGAELLGSMAISEDFPYEKCLRDAKITQLWLGGQQICRYRVIRGYYDLKNWA